jgi:hypothetical protein
MAGTKRPYIRAIYLIIIALLLATSGMAQKKSKKPQPPAGKAVMWEKVNVKKKDLFYGPGGRDMVPDVSTVTFIKEEKGGHNKKYRIKDADGRTWVAKLGREAQPETAAVRLLWALGYKTEINYLVPTITIPGKGTFKNVRLEARPDDVERLENWKWKENPFIGRREFQGLKMMMVFFNNWDIVDIQNKILDADGNGGDELEYIVSDLGSTFGRLGNNNLPVIYRLGRRTNKPDLYKKTKFVKKVKDGNVILAYKGKNRGIFKGITIEQGRWLADLLLKLDEKQVRDAFRAANYSPAEIETLAGAVMKRIDDLDRATAY